MEKAPPELETTATTVVLAHDVSFATVKVVGFATFNLHGGAQVQVPGDKSTVLRPDTRLRFPLGPNTLVAQMKSLVFAAMVTVFGIGAQLGVIGMAAFTLSAESLAVRSVALALLTLAALVLLAYGAMTTMTLADSKPGSALTAASSTSYIL